MKILRITESQYKRLVRSKNLLNEQFKRIVYLDDKDKHDVNPDMVTILDYINYKFDTDDAAAAADLDGPQFSRNYRNKITIKPNTTTSIKSTLPHSTK